MWTSYSLHSYHKIDDELFEFMLIEDGKKIAARPYKGKMGMIKVGKGGRELEKVEFKGSVYKQGNISAPIGTMEESWPRPVEECSIPIGDYAPRILYVTYDNLSIRISYNYYSYAQGHSSRKDTVYGMQVCEDKPYVLDFSNEPMVIFYRPSMNQTTFLRGDEIKFATGLIDPKLNFTIDRLHDTSVKVDKEYKYRDGKVIHTKVNKPLVANVVIARADGQVIAEGVMPFG